MTAEFNRHYSDKGGHFARGKFWKNYSKDLKHVSEEVYDLFAYNIPLGKDVRRSMLRSHSSGKR
ncbi:MAG TPA: hypothetical protein VG895_04425 [Patescibacteria group bacterium]|nr:hypothetical protein [Patescibacteria group bacterium]